MSTRAKDALTWIASLTATLIAFAAFG